jgi:hypothetical protein
MDRCLKSHRKCHVLLSVVGTEIHSFCSIAIYLTNRWCETGQKILPLRRPCEKKSYSFMPLRLWNIFLTHEKIYFYRSKASETNRSMHTYSEKECSILSPMTIVNWCIRTKLLGEKTLDEKHEPWTKYEVLASKCLLRCWICVANNLNFNTDY